MDDIDPVDALIRLSDLGYFVSPRPLNSDEYEALAEAWEEVRGDG